ncbi:MAG: hypothetical protein ACP5PS_09135, partial [Bacteroidales bacterium]
MNCESCQRLLFTIGFHRLSDTLKQEVLNHVDGCSKCAAFYQLEHQLIELVEEEKRLQPTTDIVDRVMDRIVEKEHKSFAHRQGISLSW